MGQPDRPERVRERDLFGRMARRWRTIRTSNAYLFRDPLPCPEGRPSPNPPAEGLFYQVGKSHWNPD